MTLVDLMATLTGTKGQEKVLGMGQLERESWDSPLLNWWLKDWYWSLHQPEFWDKRHFKA